MSNGAVFYKGPSQLDGAPIVGVLTGLIRGTSNPKTGYMYQTWIMRSDLHPNAALHDSSDVSVCGDCPLRRNSEGRRLCYVNPAPLGQIYNQYLKGNYPTLVSSRLSLGLRIGSYGDPTAIPLTNWQDLINKVPYATGYTRQWKQQRFQDYRRFCMASVFSTNERDEANALGWRTYRVRSNNNIALNEIDCPAAKHDYTITCSTCRLCRGDKGSIDISIRAHGNNQSLFKEESHGVYR